MHPALPGPAGTPASQTQHCYPESGEHRVAFLHHQPLRRQGIDILIFTPGSPSGPAAREWVWHTKPATLQNLHTRKKKKASTPPENSAATHTNIALVTWEWGGHRGFLSHSNVSSYRRAINKQGVRAGGGALHTSSTGQGPGSRCSRGDPPRAKEAPGSCQSCSGAARRSHSTGKHSSILGLLQFTRL